VPVGAFVKCLSERAKLALSFCVSVEITCGSECAGEKICRVDRREFAVARTTASLHVEEVIVEAFVTSGVSLFAVWSVMKEP